MEIIFHKCEFVGEMVVVQQAANVAFDVTGKKLRIGLNKR